MRQMGTDAIRELIELSYLGVEEWSIIVCEVSPELIYILIIDRHVRQIWTYRKGNKYVRQEFAILVRGPFDSEIYQ